MDLRTTYGDRSVRSTGPTDAGGAGGGGGGGDLDSLFDRVMRSRLRGLLGGHRGIGAMGLPVKERRSSAPRGYSSGYGNMFQGTSVRPDAFGGGGAATRNAKKRDAAETQILEAQARLARASSQLVPKTYKYIQGGGAYLVDNWDAVPLGLRPNTVLQGG